MPEISIVLPVYNGERFLSEAVESIINQTFQDWELVIVNDCSIDNSKSIAEEYAAKDNRIRIINNDANQKLPGSLNIGFKEASGKFLTWTSDDNVYENTALKEMYDFLMNEPAYAMVVANMTIIDDDNIFICDHMKYDKTLMAMANRVGACFLYRKEIYNKIGEYRKDYFLVEDYDYWLRIIFAGFMIGHLDKNLYIYRSHKNSLTAKKKTDVLLKMNQLRKAYLSDMLDLLKDNNTLILRLYREMLDIDKLTDYEKRLFIDANNNIAKEEMYNSTKKSIIYGCGKYGQKISRIINNVDFFCDKDDTKVGKIIYKKKVISINEMLEKQGDYQVIIALNDRLIYDAIEELCSLGLNTYCTIKSVLVNKKISYDEFVSNGIRCDNN